MNKFQKGELVFIPSSVRLVQFSYEDAISRLPLFVQKHMITQSPKRALLLETGVDNYYKVLYNGEYWFANKEDVYEGT